MHSSKAWLSWAALAAVVHAHAADHSKWQRDCAEWIQEGLLGKRTVAIDRVIGAWRPERK